MFHVTSHIAAPPERVWAILTEPAILAGGGFGITELTGQMRPGGRLALKAEIDPNRTFKLRVAEFTPSHRMVWTSGMPLGLFRGTRTFALTPDGPNTTFSMEEVFTGPMKGLIVPHIPDLQPSFETFANALKERSEK